MFKIKISILHDILNMGNELCQLSVQTISDKGILHGMNVGLNVTYNNNEIICIVAFFLFFEKNIHRLIV